MQCGSVTYRVLTAIFLLCLVASQSSAHQADEQKLIRSAGSGLWSDARTWEQGRVPGAGDRVLIRSNHRVVYDAVSKHVVRGICVSGTLSFARDRDTLLNVGLIRIAFGDQYSEEGFDCLHAEGDLAAGEHAGEQKQGGAVGAKTRPALEVGTPNHPIPAKHRAVIRLHYVEGMDKETCPAIVCCGGRMDIHGAPLSRTWVKLNMPAGAGANRLFLPELVTGWRRGDRLLITGSQRPEFNTEDSAVHVTDRPASEVRFIDQANTYGEGDPIIFGSPQIIQLDAPLERSHRGGDEFSAEVANLSRNVVVESANPGGVRGHTMYHRDSTGSLSYAEFRHLGKRDVLGKYPIHYHLVGDTMRGSYVIGVSVWDSHNRWITIHGTQYLVVRDCVGYQSVGHGFFLEDGTEVYNILDRNLAVQALIGKPLPKQVLPFDHNDGGGFWWANSLNAFTRNVATECDQHGFRFEAEKTEAFDPVLPILQPDGTTKMADIRTLPFLRFEDNEAHCHSRFGLNMGGFRGMTHARLKKYAEDENYDISDSIGGTVEGVGPDHRHPFHIRNFKVWDSQWAFHCGSPCVTVDGLNIYDCDYGIFRCTIDQHQYRDLSFREIHVHAIFFPTGGNRPGIRLERGSPAYPSTDAVDDLPPVTVITGVDRLQPNALTIAGTTLDNNDVKQVLVNGQPARPTQSNYLEWEITLPDSQISGGKIYAHALDKAGNREPRPHLVLIRASRETASR